MAGNNDLLAELITELDIPVLALNDISVFDIDFIAANNITTEVDALIQVSKFKKFKYCKYCTPNFKKCQ
jgi:hypothetical protein